MPKSQNHLKEFLVTLARHEVDFIVCGGVAAILHGVPRTTLDLDISVDMKPENLGRLFRAVEELGLKPKIPVDPRVLFEPDAVVKMVQEKGALVFSFVDPEDPIRHIDMFLTRALSYDELAKHAEKHVLEGMEIAVLSARYLLKLKLEIQPPRRKDILDIQTLSEKLDEG